MDGGAEGAISRWMEEVRELWHDGCRRRGAISRWMEVLRELYQDG